MREEISKRTNSRQKSKSTKDAMKKEEKIGIGKKEDEREDHLISLFLFLFLFFVLCSQLSKDANLRGVAKIVTRAVETSILDMRYEQISHTIFV